MRGIEIQRSYRPRRSKLQALLLESLDIAWGKKIVNIAYLEDETGVKALFEDGTLLTVLAPMLVGKDGTPSSVRSLLVRTDSAKPTPIDFATTMCSTKYSRQSALLLDSAPHHPLFQIASYSDSYYS